MEGAYDASNGGLTAIPVLSNVSDDGEHSTLGLVATSLLWPNEVTSGNCVVEYWWGGHPCDDTGIKGI